MKRFPLGIWPLLAAMAEPARAREPIFGGSYPLSF